jgi:hypothetical protein
VPIEKQPKTFIKKVEKAKEDYLKLEEQRILEKK